LSHAQKRNAKILCEIKGYGMSSDAYHYTLPDSSGDGAYRAMNNSIEDAKLEPHEIQYINAHGTSTPAGDKAEALAIDKLFMESPEKVCVSSTKSQTGHLLGAAGAVEAIFSIMSLENQIVPINLNLENELETKNINFIKSDPLQLKLVNVISNSFGFGGTNVSLIFSKFDGK
jgi:3-oxoacyl-[acyl-carrier-protein] synthase II